ncbi:MAG: PQQ-like beta-propeller repeat protein [Planctomycetia bacterium]|nr:PQQ-like beta-propeller repeat protein [Planctomycetia bacterium]
MRTRLFLAALAIASASFVLAAEPAWPGFRGPHGNGHADSKNPPTVWSEKENIRWKTAIHGKGWSSPAILGDQVWVTTADEVMGEKGPPMKGGAPSNPVKEASYFAVCIDRTSGKVIRDLKLRTEKNPAYCHPFNSYASPTPFVEEGRVYAHFGSHGTFCIDSTNGKVIWKRTDLKCDHFRGPGSSPVVYGDLLYLIFDGFDEQYVIALEKATGKTKWKMDRKIKYSTDNGDFKKAYATPTLFTIGEKQYLVCPSAECTIAYDPISGAELWRLTHGGMNGSGRPVMANGLMYLNSGHTKRLIALKPEELSGAVPKSAIAWEGTKDVSSRPSLLVAGELLFMVSDTGIASCLDATNGKTHWNERLDGEFSSSPVLAGGNVYFCNQIGKIFVVKADKTFNVVAENRLEGGFMASPAFAGDELFLRTRTHLYCVGKK